MKQKELKNLAKKIAAQEKLLASTDDLAVKARAESEIMKLSGHVHSLDDMVAVDDMVREILKNT